MIVQSTALNGLTDYTLNEKSSENITSENDVIVSIWSDDNNNNNNDTIKDYSVMPAQLDPDVFQSLSEIIKKHQEEMNNISTDEILDYAKRQADIEAIAKELNKSNIISACPRDYDEIRKEAEEIYYSQHPEQRNDMTSRKLDKVVDDYNKYIEEKKQEYQKNNPYNSAVYDIMYPTAYQKGLDDYLAQCEQEYMEQNPNYTAYKSVADYIKVGDSDKAKSAIHEYDSQQRKESIDHFGNWLKSGIDKVCNFFKNLV